MIGIVIVSHSRKLAQGLAELAQAMTPVKVPAAAAGGLADSDDLGTDATLVLQRIQELDCTDGTLLFADMGSAKLSAEMAIDLLDPDARVRVQFCDAPLVEGVLAAAVQSAMGADIDTAMREALGQTPAIPTETEDQCRNFVITNRLGLHARPAARFVNAMGQFGGNVRLENVTKGKACANAKSINGVMLSEVSQGDTLRLWASAAEAEAVFAAMKTLVADQFGDREIADNVAAGVSVETSEEALSGISIADGFAVGRIRHIRIELPDIAPVQVSDAAAEIARFLDAVRAAKADIAGMAGAALPEYDRKIFDAHLAFLEDPEILDRVPAEIAEQNVCAEAVWHAVIDRLRASYAAAGDPVIAARAADVVDVGLRVLARLTGKGQDRIAMETPAILAFEELRPSDVLALSHENVLGVLAARGGKTSHAGILAANLSVPVVFGLGDGLLTLPDGSEVLLDGGAARVVVAPDAKTIATIEKDRAGWKQARAAAEAIRMKPAVTRDGALVRVGANMAGMEDLPTIVQCGAEEVGLLRTEFLFMRRDTPPSEQEQYESYAAIVQGLNGRPLTIRTADIGGDKPIPYMQRPAEANPNLGWRGLRYSLDRLDLLDAQLAAILRASAHGSVRIMFPLVSTLDEVRAARERIDAVQSDLFARGEAFDTAIEVGIMIEVPAAAEIAEHLAQEVDFFSIGTNDLTQYVMAADRANGKVQGLFDPFHPAVLRMIDKTIRAGARAGIWTGMCGAMAGNAQAAPVLLGLGLDEFSMAAKDVAEFKMTIGKLSVPACQRMAKAVLNAPTTGAVKDMLRRFAQENGI